MKSIDWKKLFLSSSKKNKLEVYAKELDRFNKKIPLFSRKKGVDFCWELILDSYLAGQLLLKDSSQRCISDIGSGAGFPGVLLAVLDPDREIWLFESNRKKADFLKYICWKLNLKNVEVKHTTIQREKAIKCAVSKAFFPLSKRLLLTGPCFRKGAFYYHLQTSHWKKEWENTDKSTKKLWQVKAVKEYNHSHLPGKRVLLKMQKLL